VFNHLQGKQFFYKGKGEGHPATNRGGPSGSR